MDLTKIKQSKTKIIGKQIYYKEEITSTHLIGRQLAQLYFNKKDEYNECKSLENTKIQNGTIILADRQTSGIGTNGRNWYTGEANNIAMTIVLTPKCKIGKLQGLTKEIAISMKQAIKELYGYILTIKEPNDLLLQGKKICGILTEVNTMAESINYLLISVGFNVNEEYFSENTKNIATSLKDVYGKRFEREEIIVKFIKILEQTITKKIEL